MCNKRIYDTKFLSDKVCDRMKFKYMVSYRSYYCDECKGWHVTHKVNKHKVKMCMSDMDLKGVINGSRTE